VIANPVIANPDEDEPKETDMTRTNVLKQIERLKLSVFNIFAVVVIPLAAATLFIQVR
jgi:hypothetical protein